MTRRRPPPPAIRVRGLRKSFGEQLVLDGIDLDVAEGTVFALLGPNGAGKTTTIQILSTLLAADAGEVSVGGHDVTRHPPTFRGLIGVTGQISAVDGLFTGEENLRLMADLATCPVTKRAGGSPSCWSASNSSTRPGSPRPSTRVACGDGSTWR